MRDYKIELEKRVTYIRNLLKESGAKGIVFGNSGGKDSALVGILCKKACDNTVGIIMPCESARNFGEDKDDGIDVATQFNIDTRTVDLTDAKKAVVAAVKDKTTLNNQALTNIAPRLRMITVYEVAAAENLLVAGRCISTDREVYGSTRVMPVCFVTGEAAGTAAAMCCKMENVNVHELDVKLLRETLKNNGAYFL